MGQPLDNYLTVWVPFEIWNEAPIEVQICVEMPISSSQHLFSPKAFQKISGHFKSEVCLSAAGIQKFGMVESGNHDTAGGCNTEREAAISKEIYRVERWTPCPCW